MRTSRAVARDTGLNLVGALLPTLITLLTVPTYLRVIGEARYGVLTLVWIIVGYFGLFDLGLGRATTNRLARARDETLESRSAVFWTALAANLGLGAAGGLLLWGLIRVWGSAFLGIPPELTAELSAAAVTIALAVPLVTVSSVLIGSLDALQDFARANAVGVLGATLTAVLPLAAALAVEPTLGAVVSATVIGRLIAGFAALWACRQAKVFQGFRLGGLRDLTGLLGYGGWVSVSSVLSPFLASLDRFLISNRMGAQAVPFYAVPFSLLSRVQVLAGSLSRALFPRFSAEDKDKAGQAALRSIVGLAAVMTPVLVVLAPLLRPFLGWWIGWPLADKAGPVGELLVMGIWANSLAYVPYSLLQAQGRPDLTAKFHMAELVPYLVVLWIGLRYCGLAGAAFAWSLRVIVDAILLFCASRVIRETLQELRGPALLVLVSSAASILLSPAPGPRAAVALSLGTLSLVWSWNAVACRFPGLVKAGMQALHEHLALRGHMG